MSNSDSQTLQRGVAVWNDSGGVGKTTTTVNTACALGRQGADVLVIDLDPQFGSLTDHVGLDGVLKDPKYSLVDPILADSRSLTELVIDGDVLGLSWDLIPSNEGLEKFESRLRESLSPTDSLTLQLRTAISEAGFPSTYEYILIDCPATRGALVRNAVAATLNVLIPTELSRKGARSVDGIVEFVRKTERELDQLAALPEGVSTGIIGVIPNACAKTGQLTNDERGAFEYLTTHYGQYMPEFYVPDRTILDDAWASRQTLFGFADSDDTRQLRPNETGLLNMYTHFSNAIEAGGIQHMQTTPLRNIPSELRPESDDPTTETTTHSSREVHQ